MKKTAIFISISSVALVIVLVIQVNWIVQTANAKEAIFNEKANMVLARTTEALLADKSTCKNIEACLGKKETHVIDSLFQHYMNFYNFHIDYTFEVVKHDLQQVRSGTNSYPEAFSNTFYQNKQGCYQKNLDELADKSGLQLKLILPEKKQFIIAEMGAMFITSVVLILIVLFLFWRTIQSLVKEKKISEHTTDFLNNMTHEFKTPVTNIALASKMIIKNAASNQEDKTKHYTGIILEENEKLRLQVEHVLSMTALEKGEIPLQKTELDFHQLISDCVKRISIQIENKNGYVKLNLNADSFVIIGDKTHLTNAISNLIDNSIKYSKEKPEINIETFNVNQNLIVVISDKGIGIEREYQKKVFDKFFRVPTGDVHNVKGFGLGLAYIRKIIELHGGTIVLESEQGKGTSFKITLPNA